MKKTRLFAVILLAGLTTALVTACGNSIGDNIANKVLTSEDSEGENRSDNDPGMIHGESESTVKEESKREETEEEFSSSISDSSEPEKDTEDTFNESLPESTPEESSIVGAADVNTYVNKDFHIQVIIPEGWSYGDYNETPDSAFEDTESAVDSDEMLKNGEKYLDFYIRNPDCTKIVQMEICYTGVDDLEARGGISSLLTENEMESIKTGFENEGYQDVQMEKTTGNFLGDTSATVLKISGILNGIKIYATQTYVLNGPYCEVITTATALTDTTQELLDLFSKTD